MKVALVGYGKMGKTIEDCAIKRGDEVVAIVSPREDVKNKIESLLCRTKEELLKKNFDVVIDFSNPNCALDNLQFYSQNNIKVVMGTTGWHEKIEEVKQLFHQSQGALIWSGNFSLGIILFNQMLEKASQIMNKFESYDVMVHEFHHKNKLDSPSGTLLGIGEILLEGIDRKSSVQVNTLNSRGIQSHELHLTSTRGGHIPGIHEVVFDSEFDTIELKHIARSREGFAVGSLECAQWLKNKQGYFEIEDFMKDL